MDAVRYLDLATAKTIIVVGNREGSTGAVNGIIKNFLYWLQAGGTTKVLLEKMPTGTAALSGCGAPDVRSPACLLVGQNGFKVMGESGRRYRGV